MTKYYTGTYAPDHFMRDPTKEACLLMLKAYGHTYVVQLNPTDSRGYRAIIKLCGNASIYDSKPNSIDISETFNRPYTESEEKGLGIITCFMRSFYQKELKIPVAQSAQAGNNAMTFDETTKETIIGCANEPFILHTHLIGRGNPDFQYIQGYPLRGPKPYETFDMRGQTPSVPGNDKKVKWENLEDATTKIKARLSAYLQSQEFISGYGTEIDVTIWQKPDALSKVTFFSKQNTLSSVTAETPAP